MTNLTCYAVRLALASAFLHPARASDPAKAAEPSAYKILKDKLNYGAPAWRLISKTEIEYRRDARLRVQIYGKEGLHATVDHKHFSHLMTTDQQRSAWNVVAEIIETLKAEREAEQNRELLKVLRSLKD